MPWTGQQLNELPILLTCWKNKHLELQVLHLINRLTLSTVWHSHSLFTITIGKSLHYNLVAMVFSTPNIT